MDKIRNKIDQLDDQIMKLLDERFRCTKDIGNYKKINKLPVTSSTREEAVLNKANAFLYEEEIQELYRLMFDQNKAYQRFTYGLIGKHLPYTISPYLYEQFGLPNFEVLETEDYLKTTQKINALGYAVTNPYKSDAYQSVNTLDPSALSTKSVNLVVGGVGYNTDYLALVSIWERLGLDFKNLSVVIIGNGATSRSVAESVKTNVKYLVREVRNASEYLIEDYLKLKDCDVLINATPYGTSPNIQTKPLFSLREFTKLKMVVDVVYNPFRSPLLLEAAKYNIPAKNGLEMLVEQTRKNMILFNKTPQLTTQELLERVYQQSLSIIFIGMSFSGKTVLGQRFAAFLNREFIDTDVVLKAQGRDLDSVLKTGSVQDFRHYELQVASELASSQGKVISTGGGMVLTEEAMQYFKANGLVVYINPSVEELVKRIDNSRPLIGSSEDLKKLYAERKHLYERYADLEITGYESLEEIKEKIDAIIRLEWT